MGNLNRFKAKNGLDGNSLTIINVADPVNAQDAATKNFCANISNITTGTLGVARGGTGATTLTGVLKGNGTSALTAMTGTTNYVAKWTDANTIGAGIIYDDGTNIGIGTNAPNASYKMSLLGTATSAAGFYLNDSANNRIGSIYYSQGNTIFYDVTNSAERMRIDPTGHVAVGTTSTNLSSSSTAFTVNTATAANFAALEIASAGALRFYINANNTASYISSQSTNPMVFQTNGVERMRISSTGGVGIGTSSPSYRLDVQPATTTTAARFSSGSTGGATITSTNSGQGIWAAGADWNGTSFVARNTTSSQIRTDGGYISFFTDTGLTSGNTFSPNERARFDTNGDFLVGKTGVDINTAGVELRQNGVAQFTVNYAATNEAVNFNNRNTGNIPYDLAFRQQSITVGHIRVNASTTAYNTSSDYRLKENIAPMVGALDKVAALKPVTYTWKVDGTPGQGFIAHELQEIVPDAVTGDKDAVDADGNPKYQGVDTSFLVATLTAAIQELNAKVDAQAAEIAALKAAAGQGPTT